MAENKEVYKKTFCKLLLENVKYKHGADGAAAAGIGQKRSIEEVEDDDDTTSKKLKPPESDCEDDDDIVCNARYLNFVYYMHCVYCLDQLLHR